MLQRLWNQATRMLISYMAIHCLHVWPILLISANMLNLEGTSSKISQQKCTQLMAETSAF